MKKAFTLIELIFVIVLLSIISMFGADLYVKIYNSYTNNRATSDLEGETERTLNIITSLLRDRVKQTVIGRETDNGEHPDGNFVSLYEVQEKHDVLEWIGKSTETQYIGSTKGLLGWSGFAIDSSVPSGDFVIQSPGSSLKDANNILTSLNADTKSFGIIFNDGEVDANSFGYNKTNNHTNIGTVKITSDDTMQISGLASRNKNRYFLVHTAYAIVPVRDENAAKVSAANKVKSNTYNLLLYYDFQPWEGEKYNNKDGKSVVLAKNVTMFRFAYDNNSVAVKLCMRDNNRNFDAEKLDFIVCKSQVVE